MRLLNTNTLRLEKFEGVDIPDYAILSHTWTSDEVSYQEHLAWQDDSSNDGRAIQGKGGFNKIEKTCEIARRRGFNYAWVDTNCINKESSAELSEAINSMFAWYQRSALCMVWLADLEEDEEIDAMANCRWFTRGWTLQELLASRSVVFYNRGWQFIGELAPRGRDRSLVALLSSITGIDRGVLEDPRRISTVCVAKKMSWASRRETTRVEDRAYSLLGIFDINMPLLYGEGSRAFLRLQEEIMRVSTDQSLFAWDNPLTAAYEKLKQPGWVSVLARDPSAFELCGSVDVVHRKSQPAEQIFTMTNLGISIRLPLIRTNVEPGGVYAVLNCQDGLVSENTSTEDETNGGSSSSSTRTTDRKRGLVCIPLQSLRDRQWVRPSWFPSKFLYQGDLPPTIELYLPRVDMFRDRIAAMEEMKLYPVAKAESGTSVILVPIASPHFLKRWTVVQKPEYQHQFPHQPACLLVGILIRRVGSVRQMFGAARHVFVALLVDLESGRIRCAILPIKGELWADGVTSRRLGEAFADGGDVWSTRTELQDLQVEAGPVLDPQRRKHLMLPVHLRSRGSSSGAFE